MKELSGKELERRRIIGLAVLDYFGAHGGVVEDITKAIINGKVSELKSEYKKIAAIVKENLADQAYRIALGESL